MAVYTPVSRAQLEPWLKTFDLGALTALEGIGSGIENTNFFVDTDRGRYVLTLFERLRADELPYYLGLMSHLAARGLPCPAPIANRRGQTLGTLNGKPAALVTRLAGASCIWPTPAQCAEIGTLLAKMHLAAADYPVSHPNPRGLDWQCHAADEVAPFLDPDTATLLTDEIRVQRACAEDHRALPGGPVHADLFRDNVLFEHEAVGGVIDFYFACNERWLYDLAVTCNDWCIDDAGDLDPLRLGPLLAAYTAVRPMGAAERRAWPTMLCAAALRFWVSRLHDLYLPRPAEVLTPKDPRHFEHILRRHRAGNPPAFG